MELINELLEKNKELSASIKILRKHGTALAEAERDYKIALSKKALMYREENMPVTLIQLVIHGEKEVAEKRFKRDIAKTMYDANQEHINVTKLQIKIIESQLQREYYA